MEVALATCSFESAPRAFVKVGKILFYARHLQKPRNVLDYWEASAMADYFFGPKGSVPAGPQIVNS